MKLDLGNAKKGLAVFIVVCEQIDSVRGILDDARLKGRSYCISQRQPFLALLHGSDWPPR